MLSQLKKEKIELIKRIAGVSDNVLKEQLREEYECLEKKIDKEEKISFEEKMKELEKKHMEDYLSQFLLSDNLLTSLEITNELPDKSLKRMIKKANIKKPTGPHDRRTICMMCNALGFQIDVCDLESNVMDTIGKKADVKYKLYVNAFARLDKMEYDSFAVRKVDLFY